jgi:SAM-dependent methyltransferase
MTAATVGDHLGDDPVAVFYDQHPYPPPVAELDAVVTRSAGDDRVEHHRVWPARAAGTVKTVLVAGCGTSQAVRYALRRPAARVVGIDVSEAAIEHTSRLAAAHGVDNLELHRLPLEEVDQLGARFDHIVCTGVLHHLADPVVGLTRLREVLAPGGAVTLMVYGRYGRTGVYMLQEYCRRVGMPPTPAAMCALVAARRALRRGKRVRAHNGGDPGAGDPPIICYFKWNEKTSEFDRHIINKGEVGIGLQIRTADISGNGALDIVVAGKEGTQILFNQRNPQ